MYSGVIAEPLQAVDANTILLLEWKGKHADTKKRRVFKIKRKQSCCKLLTSTLTFNIQNEKNTKVGSITKVR